MSHLGHVQPVVRLSMLLQEAVNEELGKDHERYTRKLPLDSVIRPQYRGELKRKLTNLCGFLREVVFRAQIFVNGYIISSAGQEITAYVYTQSFWYSVCQVILDKKVSNKNSNMPSDLLGYWAQFRATYPSVIFSSQGFSGYSDALSAACKTLATCYTNNIVETFENRVVQYSIRKLKAAVPELPNGRIKDFAREYIYERVCGGDPLWPGAVPLVSTHITGAVNSLCEELSSVIPVPATAEIMSASPGRFVPALRYILSIYDEEYKNSKGSDDEELPRRFSLSPMPSTKWRFATINAKALSCLTESTSEGDFEQNSALFHTVFDFTKLGYRSVEELKNSSVDRGVIFTNQLLSHGFAVDFQFARKSVKKERATVDTELTATDFTEEEITDCFQPCAVDPGRSQVFTAAYGCGNSPHEIRRCSTREYYTYTGSPLRQKVIQAEKKKACIEAIETDLETGKTQSLEVYDTYVRCTFQHMDALFAFYGPTKAEAQFRDYQGRQRAPEEMVNILTNGGKKIQQKPS
ncbi:hypothetical protein EC973_004497 [Apophysomyces ossiformis]|uniref:Uncharacterized protein n=1 Tax=Apophysomyces ossiformis TaxID=679940 RepID=A0A8H7ELQ8_9FUNG|nr:hypothetical protein EC973_004497 [Apophysomyces ossiformis]